MGAFDDLIPAQPAGVAASPAPADASRNGFLDAISRVGIQSPSGAPMESGSGAVASGVQPVIEIGKSPQAQDPNDFSAKFNTQLSPEEEAKYQSWAKAQNRQNDVYDYDLRGFWKAGNQFAENGHGADSFKKPNHPTFSDQSIYHGVTDDSGQQQLGGSWGQTTTGMDTYTPSTQMMSTPQAATALQDYFKKYERGVWLQMPDSIGSKE